MRALIVYCHPSTKSFNKAILDVVTERLEQSQSEYRVIDLYAQGFDPVLDLKRWNDYENCEVNTRGLEDSVSAIAWCNTLIFIYPTWWYGLPAILKGWCERVLVPGVAFHLPISGAGGDIEPALTHIKNIGVFTTCGASRWLTILIGSPGKRTLLRGIRLLCNKRCKTSFTAHYLMDSSTSKSRFNHLLYVGRKMDRFIRRGHKSDKTKTKS